MPWKKVAFHNYYLAAAVLALISAAGIIFVKSFMPDIVPFYFGKPVGADQLLSYWFFLMIPGVSLAITVINFFIGMSAKDEFVKQILAVSTLVVSAMAAITVTKIILLVGFF